MKPTVPLLCALLVPMLASAQDLQKPVLASTYVAPARPAATAPDADPKPPAATSTAAPRMAAVSSDSATDPEAGEPNVKVIVIEADGTRIEELRVRGVSQSVKVQTRLGPKEGYEIIMGDGSRDLSPGANTSRGATGQRVWHVLSF